MSAVPRRTISELIMRYRLEPSICDFYVEGDSDFQLFSWFFECFDRHDIRIYKISSVEICANTLLENNLQSNNRDRLILLARELSRKLADWSGKIGCAVDRDFSIDEDDRANRLIFASDFYSVEVYAFDKNVLRKVLRLGLNLMKNCNNLDEMMIQFQNILNELYAIRLANQRLQWNMKWLPFDSSIKFDGEVMIFRSSDFIKKYLSKNQRLNQLAEFNDTLVEIKKQCEKGRAAIRGHDLVDLLVVYSNSGMANLPTALRNREFAARALMTALSIEELMSHKQFKKIHSNFLKVA